jgi:hypothetical protein
MTEWHSTAVNVECVKHEVSNHIDAHIRILQQARLDERRNATLENLFKGRNPDFLRATRKVAFELVRYCLDNYLLSVDEMLFTKFKRELSAFMARRGQRMLEPAATSELFAQDDLPLRIELLEEYDRVYNRLTYRFYEEFCDEDSRIDWARLTRFIFQCDADSQAE